MKFPKANTSNAIIVPPPGTHGGWLDRAALRGAEMLALAREIRTEPAVIDYFKPSTR
jgi:hypothetical protein